MNGTGVTALRQLQDIGIKYREHPAHSLVLFFDIVSLYEMSLHYIEIHRHNLKIIKIRYNTVYSINCWCCQERWRGGEVESFPAKAKLPDGDIALTGLFYIVESGCLNVWVARLFRANNLRICRGV